MPLILIPDTFCESLTIGSRSHNFAKFENPGIPNQKIFTSQSVHILEYNCLKNNISKEKGHYTITRHVESAWEHIIHESRISMLSRSHIISSERQEFSVQHFFPAHQLFAKKQWKGLTAIRIFWVAKWSAWSGVVTFRKSNMYAHSQIGLNELINMMYFVFNLNAYFSRNWRKCS